ncbi:MAG: hypothetical protein JXA90_07170 [Planctomycetes bacterium]|nr:hypothetical protein [Planctomycetota bacterium]
MMPTSARELIGAGGLLRSRVGPRGEERPRERGAILIVALGVLTLLAVLGATFAQLMSLEKKAADNYVEAQRMDLLTNSAIDTVVARLHDYTNRQSWASYAILMNEWLFALKGEKDLAHGRADVSDPRVGQWTTYSRIGGKRYRYKTKVIDCASQINLNGRQDRLARMLDNLGRAIEGSPRLKREPRVITNPFYTGPHHGGLKVRGVDILLFRQRLEGQRFQSKSQLRQLIGDENYDLVKDFLTCHSWEDPFTYRADDGANEVPDLASGGVTVAVAGRGGGGLGGGGLEMMPAASDNPRLAHEPRCPININTAPEEVLVAAIQELACRRIFPYSQLGGLGGSLEAIDRNAQIQGQRLLEGQEEIRDVRPRAVFVYSQALDYGRAVRLAREIIARRKNVLGTFRAWRTNEPNRPGFEDFVDLLPADVFPSPSSVEVIDPEDPNNRRIKGAILSGAVSPVGRLWVKGNAQGAARAILSSRGLPVHDANAWYYEMMKGMLKANFNPNTRINRYNPNPPVYVPVDKSDLVWFDPATRMLKKGHTTEFCFDTMGVYEITTLGEMADLVRVGSSAGGSTTVVSSGAQKPEIYPFTRKMRTVVKVYDVLRHTSQYHFEKTFSIGSRTSASNRRNVVTWPEPVEALTELYTRGSLRDGRVELAGLLDAQRFNVPVQNRLGLAGKHPSVLLESGLVSRDPISITRLRMAISSGSGIGLGGDQVTNALKEVYDADYSRDRSIYRRIYRRAELTQIPNIATSLQALYIDPIVNREALGTDLLPDGFHSGITRMPHLGNRMIVYPARSRIGESGVGGGNPTIGASGRSTRGRNILGNVPYYNGGLAFWVKFEFNGDDPVFSGLIGCTQVIREVVLALQDFTGSEGTQFYIFKNSVGQLRIVRMYYHQAFPPFGGEGTTGSIQLYPDPGTAAAGAGGAGAGQAGQNPILEELDQMKWISRSDILLDVSHFRAHEWHHIAVDWNDQNLTRPIRLYLDFEEVREAVPRIAQARVDGTANSWVRLNERQPKDGLQIGGILRDQAVADAGIFKWYTNSTTTGQGGGVVLVAPQVKRILANATIDEIITYEGTFEAAKSYYGGRGQPGYFTNQTGEYANTFDIPLPMEVDKITLRSLDWTSYYPVTYTDSRQGSPPQALSVTPILCEVNFNSPRSPPAPRSEPWRQPTLDNFIAGRDVYRRPSGLKGTNAELVYIFRMTGGRAQTGRSAGGIVQTPAIDDVTLTYFLPTPKTLLQEEDS